MSQLILRQVIDDETSTYTYLVADAASKAAVIIDPVLSQFDRDVQLVESLGLRLTHVLETHVHADHVTASSMLRDRFGATVITSKNSGVACANRYVDDGDEISFGPFTLEVVTTPGHTAGCVSFVLRGANRPMVFTGDALFIRGCGRTDFQQGNARTLFHSVRNKLFALSDDTLVYPAHDYKGRTVSTIAEEKQLNPRLNLEITEDEFVTIMDGLDLAHPKYMDVAVPRNLVCGQNA